MIQFKGTKGKWVRGVAFQGETKNIHIKTDGDLIIVEDLEGIAVAILGRANEEEQEANAKLIAAAPELLEALKASKAVFEALGIYANHKIAGEQYDKVVEAIKKATE